jgi:hypothetical protein
MFTSWSSLIHQWNILINNTVCLLCLLKLDAMVWKVESYFVKLSTEPNAFSQKKLSLFFHWSKFSKLIFAEFFLAGFARHGVLNNDLTVWLDRVRDANICVPVWPENRIKFSLIFGKSGPRYQNISIKAQLRTSTLSYFWNLQTNHELKLLLWVKIGSVISSLNGKILPNSVTLSVSHPSSWEMHLHSHIVYPIPKIHVWLLKNKLHFVK